MSTIGFLHTADVHVATFQQLMSELAPGRQATHLVDADLLADARAAGITPELVERLHGRLGELVAAGADLIVCTCSTIGAAAEKASGSVGVPVLRGDRPMAEAAVATGTRIAVVAAVESTMDPTMALLRESAARAGRSVTLVPAPCYAAWPLFEAGEHDRYHAEVAAHVRTVAGEVDVVVLAQASMTPAARLLPGLPVLTSPRTAVAAATSIS
jgi:Asp/Glu/hydantoin racemase